MTTAKKIFLFELGTKVKDKVTGYVGIITCRTEWLYGCIRYSVQAQEMKDGKPVDPIGLDEAQCELIVEAKPQPVSRAGGPKDMATRAPDAKR